MINRAELAAILGLLVMGVLAVLVELQSPTAALPDGPGRWIDGVCVGVWFAAAAVAYPVAYVRRRRRRRRQERNVVQEAEAILRRSTGV